jgi:hypothetical protein
VQPSRWSGQSKAVNRCHNLATLFANADCIAFFLASRIFLNGRLRPDERSATMLRASPDRGSNPMVRRKHNANTWLNSARPSEGDALRRNPPQSEETEQTKCSSCAVRRGAAVLQAILVWAPTCINMKSSFGWRADPKVTASHARPAKRRWQEQGRKR